MKTMGKLAALIAAAALLGSCCQCRKQHAAQLPLVGVEWQAVQLDGRDIAPEADSFTVLFGADGRLAGRGDCNRLMGGYTLAEKNRLQVVDLASTRMACPDPEREQLFMDVLTSATHYEMDGAMMMLLSDGSLRGVFQARTGQAGEE